jgi:hypothetical protein
MVHNKWVNETKGTHAHNSEAGLCILIFQVKCREASWETFDILEEFSLILI